MQVLTFLHQCNLFYKFIMKKFLVTYRVKDPDWWLLNNTLQESTEHLGWQFELFRQPNSSLVGYVVEIPNEDDVRDMLLNSTQISDRLKKHGVLFETIQVLEAVTDLGKT